MKLKRLISLLTASAIGFSCVLTASAAAREDQLSGSAAYGQTDGQSSAPFGGHNYRLSYKNSFPEGSSQSCAVIKLSEPSGTLTFMDNMPAGRPTASSYYTGTVEIGDEVYDIYRGMLSYYDTIYEMPNNYNIVRAKKEDEDVSRTVSVPVYAIAEVLKSFGFREGTVTEITCGEWDGVKAEITEDETSVLDGEEPYRVYVDMAKRSSGSNIYFDGYDFYGDSDGYYTQGPQMIAYPQGAFSVTVPDGCRVYQPCMMFCGEKRYERINASALQLSDNEDIVIDHRIDDKLEGKYSIECMIELVGNGIEMSGALKVVEKLSGMEPEEFFKASDYNTTWIDGFRYNSGEFIKTYTADGRKYDLYKVVYRNGWTRNREEYVAIRQKQPGKGEIIEGSVSLNEHMNNIFDDYKPSDYTVISAMTDVRMVENTGSCDVLKNEVRDSSTAYDSSSNCCLDYEYTYTGDKTDCYAKVSLKEPDAELIFYENPNDLSKSNRSYDLQYYVGTIELGGKIYNVYRKSYLSYYEKYDELPNDYSFVCVTDPNNEDDPSAVRKVSIPLYALIDAAKAFGFRKGTLAGFSVESSSGTEEEMNILKKEITLDKESILDKEDAYKVYSDYTVNKREAAFLDGYDHEGEIYTRNGYIETVAKRNGCFSIKIPEGESAGRYPCALTGAGINRERYSFYDLNCHNDVTADYSIDNSLEGKYGIEYLFELYNPGRPYIMTRYNLKVVEKMSGLEPEDYWNAKDGLTQMSHDASIFLRQHSFVKTYTAGGHEYDLYEVRYSGKATLLYEYVAIRKDQPEDGTAFEGSVSMQEHLNRIDDYFCSENQVMCAKLNLRMVETAGSCDVLKNDIRFVDYGEPEFIKGDFNGDRIVSAMDVIAAKKLLVSQNAEADEYTDLNGSGALDVGDIVLLQRFVLGSSKNFSATE
ncbi:MAG: dockerin type I repeat-containing protein [Ruminococcus sp.]|nr:dockerin type I repeat-containing protein [Ruminococcus sp.]